MLFECICTVLTQLLNSTSRENLQVFCFVLTMHLKGKEEVWASFWVSLNGM